MSYPAVLSEDDTLDAVLTGRSLARVGEGELRIALGQSIKSQGADGRLAAEMKAVLADGSPALVGLPRNWDGMPAERFWRQFEQERYSRLYGAQSYGSAFISRPDMVRAIDRPDYWKRCESLWRGKDVVLASRSPKVIDLSAAASVRFVACPTVGAYSEIDRIEAEIGTPTGPVLLAIGATATVLAVRLARKGMHAIDIGHLGAFMTSAGIYSVERQALISDAYVEQNRELHKWVEAYGVSGRKYCAEVMAYSTAVDAYGVLDYGSGKGTLKTALIAAGYARPVCNYDPAMKGINGLPKPADLVVCTDVLEHVEPDKLTAVLGHIHRLAGKAAFLVIATRPAKKSLPDGRNAHLIVKDAIWWSKQVAAAGLKVEHFDNGGREYGYLKLWCRK